MNVMRYLCIRWNPRWKGGAKPDVAVRSGLPNLRANEIALKLNLDIPDELFARPTLEANIQVPAGGSPPEISAEGIEAISEAIKKETGVDLTIRLIEEAK